MVTENHAALWYLARTAAAGGSIQIDNLGRSFDPVGQRPIRVAAGAEDNGTDESQPDIMWHGTDGEWASAIKEAVNRPFFAGTIPGWEPGPHEAAMRAEAQGER